MENTANYWKDLYFKVYSENRQLRLELETLQKSYEELTIKYKSIKLPSKSESCRPNTEMKISHSVDLGHIQTMTNTIVAPGYAVQKLLEPNLKNTLIFTPNSSKKPPIPQIEEKCEIEEDLNPDISLFEEIFILSVNSTFKEAAVIDRYPQSTDM